MLLPEFCAPVGQACPQATTQQHLGPPIKRPVETQIVLLCGQAPPQGTAHQQHFRPPITRPIEKRILVLCGQASPQATTHQQHFGPPLLCPFIIMM